MSNTSMFDDHQVSNNDTFFNSSSHATIGTCGNCGGAVTMHTGPWFGVVPPTPTCSSCGASPKPRGPVIPMGPPQI